MLLPSEHVQCLDLVASVSQKGVTGEIRFTGSDSETEGGAAVLATAKLNVGLGHEGEYTWGIYEFPIDYTKVRNTTTYLLLGH